MYNNSLYGNFRNRKFTDIWSDVETFQYDYQNSGLYNPDNCINDASQISLFYLLYSEYGNSIIASEDENQFKYQIFSTIFEYGPSWEKKLEIQNKLRNLSDEELDEGAKTIYNKALNPGNAPSTAELDHVNEQTVAKIKRGKLTKYAQLYEILTNDVTKTFISKFKKYFLQIVIPELPLWYITEGEQND